MKRKNFHIAIAILGILCLIIGFLFDKQILNAISSLKNNFLDTVLLWITNFGSAFVVLVIMTTLFLWQEHKREWIAPLWVSYLAAIATTFILKTIIARPRILGEYLYPIFNISSHSFPSMHATAVFAVIPILDKEFPKFKTIWVIFAFLVIFSRIYFKFHYPSDVIAGALIGYFIGLFFINIETKYRIFRKLTKKA